MVFVLYDYCFASKDLTGMRTESLKLLTVIVEKSKMAESKMAAWNLKWHISITTQARRVVFSVLCLNKSKRMNGITIS